MKKHLNTDFRKFILEKLTNGRRTEDDELEEVVPDDEIEQPIEEDPQDDDDEGLGDDVIDELLNEYKKIKKKHELYKLHRRK